MIDGTEELFRPTTIHSTTPLISPPLHHQSRLWQCLGVYMDRSQLLVKSPKRLRTRIKIKFE